MDRYMKIVCTIIAIALVSIAVKDVELFPIAEAPQGWELDNELVLNNSMQTWQSRTRPSVDACVRSPAAARLITGCEVRHA